MGWSGWIQLHRPIFDNWTYDDSDYFKIWITILLRASHNDYNQLVGNQIIKLGRGDFVFGRPQWVERLKIKDWKLKKAINLMQKEGMIVKIITDSKFTIYHINNYEKYQQQQHQQESKDISSIYVESHQQEHHQSTSNAPTEHQQRTIIKKDNKENKDNKEYTSYGEFGNLKMAANKMDMLRDKYPDFIDRCISASDGWIQEKGLQHKYKDWYAFLRNWCEREQEKHKPMEDNFYREV